MRSCMLSQMTRLWSLCWSRLSSGGGSFRAADMAAARLLGAAQFVVAASRKMLRLMNAEAAIRSAGPKNGSNEVPRGDVSSCVSEGNPT